MKRIILKPKEDRRLLRGHRWVYRNECDTIPTLQDGALVDVFADGGRFVGRGFFQAEGGVAVRLMTRRQEDIGGGFLAQRLEAALKLRERLFPGENVYRWIHGESDGLPGLTIDRYNSVAVGQSACAFYAGAADTLAEQVRSLNGVESFILNVAGKRFEYGPAPASVMVNIGEFDIEVDLAQGQKTGLFLDQRVNALSLTAWIPPSARVLDAHCYAGLWGMSAARCGAADALGVDSSNRAVEQAQANAARNGLDRVCRFECADVEEVLARGDTYGAIFLDPPAFAKSRQQAAKAMGRYQELNRAAIEALEPGGLLITSSCSHFVSREAFLETLKRAARSAQRELALLSVTGAAPDHPVLLAMPETEYLTCAAARAL